MGMDVGDFKNKSHEECVKIAKAKKDEQLAIPTRLDRMNCNQSDVRDILQLCIFQCFPPLPHSPGHKTFYL